MNRVALVLVAVVVACNSYGDEDDHPLPNRAAGSSSSSGDGGGPTTGTSSGAADLDAGKDAAPVRFCATEAAKGAIRCLDFDDEPARPFGFDQVLAAADGVVLAPSPFPGGDTGLQISTKLAPQTGVIDALPQANKPFSIGFDAQIESVTGAPTIFGVIGAGTNCPASQGSIGVVADAVAGGATIKITNVTAPLGTAKLGVPFRLTLASDAGPAPGRTINLEISMTTEGATTKTAVVSPLPAGCQNFTAAVGLSGTISGDAKITYDNVLLK